MTHSETKHFVTMSWSQYRQQAHTQNLAGRRVVENLSVWLVWVVKLTNFNTFRRHQNDDFALSKVSRFDNFSTTYFGKSFCSLRSEDPKFRCTHPRTNWDHNNAFPWSVRRYILKVARMKVGRNRPNQRFSKSHVIPMGKNEPKIHVFQCTLYKE